MCSEPLIYPGPPTNPNTVSSRARVGASVGGSIAPPAPLCYTRGPVDESERLLDDLARLIDANGPDDFVFAPILTPDPGYFPDAWTGLGVAILIASGIYVSLRERKLHLKRDETSAPT